MRKPAKSKDRMLVTGASGQIGTVLTESLIEKYGANNVVATDIAKPRSQGSAFEYLDILDRDKLSRIIDHYEITQIYHLVAILSAKGEVNPALTWRVNMEGLFNVLELAVAKNLEKVFAPSSIAVYGTDTPSIRTPQQAIFNPNTVYGISKLAGERWMNYYYNKHGLDVRSLRYPGIVSHQTMAGGGTTDYAVEIYHYAIQHQAYQCFLKADTRLPMIYMPDAIRATLELMDAPADRISVRDSYNLAGMNFTPAEITRSIQQYIPEFEVQYVPDKRQAIADTWSDSIDDSVAHNDWGWAPQYNLEEMTKDMIHHLNLKYEKDQFINH